MTKVRIDRMTSPEVAQAVASQAPVLIPLGTIETQGDHCPMGSDALVADWLTERVCRRIGCVMLPTIPFGYSHFSKSFPGTIHLRAQTFYDLLLDTLTSLVEAGFDHLIIINNHGLQEGIVGQVCDTIRERWGMVIPSVFPSRVVIDLCGDIFPDGRAAVRHGGEVSISRLLVICPEDVVLDNPQPSGLGQFQGFTLANPLAISFKGSTVNLYMSMESATPTGGFGDPSHASVERGAEVLKRVEDYLVDFVIAFRNVETGRRTN